MTQTQGAEPAGISSPVSTAAPDPATYPITVAYDGATFISSDFGTGKGAYLRNFLGRYRSAFSGLAPVGQTIDNLPMVQRGDGNYLIWQQTSLPSLITQVKPDVFLAPYNTSPLRVPRGVKMVSVVHDLILHENLTDATLKRRLIDGYRGLLLHRTIKRSSLIVTVSNFTAGQIRRRYPSSNVHVIQCTVAPSWFVRGNVVPTEERKPYVLIVTSNRAHKNIPRAMQAFARYRALDLHSRIKLRMVGISTSAALFLDIARKLGLPEDAVVIEPFLSESDLQGLYRHALSVLLPSRMEGFGIPALEALASGTPLLSSNAWSLPEVGGDVPLYFDPTDVEAMAQALLSVCTQPALRASLAERGLARAEEFHPDRIQAEIEAFWQHLPELAKSWKQ